MSESDAVCRNCAFFRNDPELLEASVAGLNALGSAWASSRSSDGLCERHDRYVTADRGCTEFRRRA